MLHKRKLYAALILASASAVSACKQDAGGAEEPTGPKEVSGSFSDALEASGPRLDRSTAIAGTDDNKNGVRDEIENYISNMTWSAAQKASLLQASKSMNAAMVEATSGADSIKLRAIFASIGNGVHCVWTQYNKGEAIRVLEEIRNVTVNTPERFAAYNEYNKLVSGFSARLPKGNTCENP